MKKYLVLEQKEYDERLFKIKDIKTGDTFNVDLYSNGNFEPEEGADETVEKWKNWLKKKFVGKEIEIEELAPNTYFISGKANLLN